VYATYSYGPSSVDETVGALEVAVRVEMALVQVLHAFGDIGHKRQLEAVIKLHLVIHHHVLH